MKQSAAARTARWMVACTCLPAAMLSAIAGPPGDGTRYEDRLIDHGALALLEDEDPLFGLHDPLGLPRRVGVELRSQNERVSGLPTASARWLVAHGSVDTRNFGSVSIDAATRLGDSAGARGYQADRPASFTLVQRRMPFDGGWHGTHALGLVSTGSVDLIARQTRFGVPTRTVLGVAAEWSQAPQGLLLMAATGEPVLGTLVGQGGYTALGGRDSVAGARWHINPAWSVAGQWARHRAPSDPGLDDHLRAFGALQAPDADAAMTSLRYEGHTRYAQFNLLATRDAGAPLRTGGWLDAGADDGTVEHRLGLNWLPRRQHWLGIPLSSGSSGGYYRWRWRSRQWLAEAQLDHQRPADAIAPSAASPSTQGWTSLRYQLDQRSAYGLQALASTGGLRRHALLLWREVFDEHGSHRVFAGVERQPDHAGEWQFGVTSAASWGDTRWSASAAALMRSGAAPGSDLSASATRELGTRLSFALGGRRFASPGRTSRVRSLNAALQFRIAPRWLLTASINDSAGSQLPPQAGPTPSAPGLLPQAADPPHVRAAWLSLRYDLAAGSSEAPLGGRPGSGGGSIAGTVFLDANANGEADAGEALLGNITVVLDERWALRTDARGRFEFPFVITGEHSVRVLPDNIPLPWGFDGADTRRVAVSYRGTATLRWGALRQ